MRQRKVVPKKTALALIKAGADVNAKEKYGGTPLYLAACFGHTEIALALIKAGADINAKEEYGGTPLHWACSQSAIIVSPLSKRGRIWIFLIVMVKQHCRLP